MRCLRRCSDTATLYGDRWILFLIAIIPHKVVSLCYHYWPECEGLWFCHRFQTNCGRKDWSWSLILDWIIAHSLYYIDPILCEAGLGRPRVGSLDDLIAKHWSLLSRRGSRLHQNQIACGIQKDTVSRGHGQRTGEKLNCSLAGYLNRTLSGVPVFGPHVTQGFDHPIHPDLINSNRKVRQGMGPLDPQLWRSEGIAIARYGWHSVPSAACCSLQCGALRSLRRWLFLRL